MKGELCRVDQTRHFFLAQYLKPALFQRQNDVPPTRAVGPRSCAKITAAFGGNPLFLEACEFAAACSAFCARASLVREPSRAIPTARELKRLGRGIRGS